MICPAILGLELIGVTFVDHIRCDLVQHGKGMRVPAPIMWKAVTGGWWLSCSMYTTVPSESCACHVSPSMGLKGLRQDWKTCCSPATNLHASSLAAKRHEQCNMVNVFALPGDDKPHPFNRVNCICSLSYNPWVDPHICQLFQVAAGFKHLNRH